MKRIILILSIMLLSQSSTWAYDFEVDNIQYTVISLEDMTAEVSGISDESLTEVVISETVDYKGRIMTVISIGASAFSGNKKLESVSIPSTVTTISERAFYNCTSLSQITLSDGLQTLDSYAFYGCSSLFQISLPESLQSIGSYAFDDSGLETFTWPESLTSIPDYCFCDCKNLTEINLSSQLESIGGSAFRDCSSLKELDIPNSVTSIGNYAVNGCTGLESLQVGAGVTYLLDYCHNTYRTTSNTSIIYYYYYYPTLWKSSPLKMKSIVLKDGYFDFCARGYGYTTYPTSTKDPTPQKGEPIFSNMDIEYYYVGRPIVDIDSWTYTYIHSYADTRTINYRICESDVSQLSQPYGNIQTLEIGGYCTDVPYFYQSIEYLILGENVETFTASNIYQGDMKGIICRGNTPPTVDGTFDNYTYLNVTLYVPKGSLDVYQTATVWKDFWEIEELEEMPSGYDAVESVAAYRKADVISYHTTDGKQVPHLQRGINIIRYSDGTARKVAVK